MAVTRDDVARAAGVSVATVSYVLNGGPRPVSEERRRRVLEAVASLDYRPNAIARSLRARRTRILGLVLPDSANPYFAALSHAIEEAATERGYQVIIANAAERPEREAGHIEALLRLQVDGLFWIPADLRRAGWGSSGARGGARGGAGAAPPETEPRQSEWCAADPAEESSQGAGRGVGGGESSRPAGREVPALTGPTVQVDRTLGPQRPGRPERGAPAPGRPAVDVLEADHLGGG
ncbi:MAG TPA: LacI family DNA-binding transcriptional regulator, partial [Chloroflexota bacterium]|nr:LacI family DNA-binding transcriptional regulator [Chloroflexota bacterium]